VIGLIAAFIIAMALSVMGTPLLIRFLVLHHYGQFIRQDGPTQHLTKRGTPTMGGLIIIISTLIPVLLFTKLHNVYIVLLVVSVLWMGAIGFIDDYLKKIKKNKDGLSGKFKVIGQVGLGLIVGVTMYFHEGVVIKREVPDLPQATQHSVVEKFSSEEKAIISTVPFVKNK